MVGNRTKGVTGMRKGLTVWDGVVYFAVAMVAILLLLLQIAPHAEGETLIVICGKEKSTYSLSSDIEMTFCHNGYSVIVAVHDGKASVKAADCPDKLCCRMGEISKSGASIACLPAGIYIRIEGSGADEADFIAG